MYLQFNVYLHFDLYLYVYVYFYFYLLYRTFYYALYIFLGFKFDCVEFGFLHARSIAGGDLWSRDTPNEAVHMLFFCGREFATLHACVPTRDCRCFAGLLQFLIGYGV